MYASYNPYYSAWPSYSSRHVAYTNQLFIPAMSPSQLHSRDSVSSGSSSLSPSDFDEGYITTEDPQYAEHSHQHQSQIQVYEEQQSLPIVFPSLECAPPKAGMYHTPVSPNTALGLSPKKSSRHSGKNRAAKYKTKPCKFYNTLKGCPTGEGCTFIHGESDRALLNLSLSSGGNGAHLSPKALSLGEEGGKKNFFPIPWRVIGGGVLLSSKQSRRNSRSRDRGSGQDELVEEGVNNATATLKQQAVPHVVPPDHDERPKPRRRLRSNSIPPTPSSAHVKVNTLFSAESPGVL
ncbi:hypothetical protein BDQ17DRAFT_1343206 [Cyathus striatus]|nr:hypothetical protein BDQ17DRAFT_1343206 [Cyathus striatus]